MIRRLLTRGGRIVSAGDPERIDHRESETPHWPDRSERAEQPGTSVLCTLRLSFLAKISTSGSSGMDLSTDQRTDSHVRSRGETLYEGEPFFRIRGP